MPAGGGLITLVSRLAADRAPGNGPAPLLLPLDLLLTPEQFERVCAANPEAVLELDGDGRLIVMTPAGGETSLRNAQLLFQLERFAKASGEWKGFDSSTGFRLPDGSVLSPDASLVRLERWQALTPEQRRGFAPLCPDLVVELVSPRQAPGGDGPRAAEALRRKMALYQANGARLGWLLLPEERAVEIWRASGPPRRLEPAEELEGGREFPGLQVDLAEIWSV